MKLRDSRRAKLAALAELYGLSKSKILGQAIEEIYFRAFPTTTKKPPQIAVWRFNFETNAPERTLVYLCGIEETISPRPLDETPERPKEQISALFKLYWVEGRATLTQARLISDKGTPYVIVGVLSLRGGEGRIAGLIEGPKGKEEIYFHYGELPHYYKVPLALLPLFFSLDESRFAVEVIERGLF